MSMINTISKPKVGVIDCDFLIFSAASSPSGEQVMYVYKDGDTEIARFESAAAGKNWIDEIEMFGFDGRFGFEGDPLSLIRTTEYEPKSLLEARKNFDKNLKKWIREAGVEDWVGRCASAKGAKSFRNEIATLTEYKGNRTESRKPFHLESVRKYAMSKEQIKKAIGGFETDDLVCAIAQKGGSSHVVIACDKDARGVSGCWYHIPGDTEEPEYSDGKIVGNISSRKKGTQTKLDGHGWLFWLAQSLTGDTADNYKGCKGYGPSKAADVLSQFNGKPLSFLPEAAKVACSVFKEVYGDVVEYNHWRTGEAMRVSYKDLFLENLTLAYMVKSKSDKPQVIIDAVNSM